MIDAYRRGYQEAGDLLFLEEDHDQMRELACEIHADLTAAHYTHIDPSGEFIHGCLDRWQHNRLVQRERVLDGTSPRTNTLVS